MFDFNKLGDMSKLASQAKQLQARQERAQQEQLELLKRIADKLDTVIALLKNKQ